MNREWKLVPEWEQFAVSNYGEVFDTITRKFLHPTTGKKPQVWLKKKVTRSVLLVQVGWCWRHLLDRVQMEWSVVIMMTTHTITYSVTCDGEPTKITRLTK